MLEKATIARPYAEAAFAEALAEGRLADWAALLRLLGLIVADRQMRAALNHPRLSRADLRALIIELMAAGLGDLSPTGRNFIKLLIEAERIHLAGEISALFEKKRAAAEGIRAVEIIAAYPLDAAQREMISKAVSERIGHKVQVQTRADKALIGGAVIRLGDAVIDVSLKGRLRALNNVFLQA